jgi:conjugative transposon TraM protein
MEKNTPLPEQNGNTPVSDKANASSTPSFLVSEEEEKALQERNEEKALAKKQQLKKIVIYALMGIIFLACMYLLFGGGSEQEQTQVGINEVIPQATETLLPSDKEKAYEEALLEEKEADKKASLNALSDYWQEDEEYPEAIEEEEEPTPRYRKATPNAFERSAQSYRDIHQTLGSFYQDNSAYEEQQRLKEEIASLKSQLSNKQDPTSIDAQMALMEKSYEMASRYLPKGQQNPSMMGGAGSQEGEGNNSSEADNAEQSKNIAPVYTPEEKVVSRLPRKQSEKEALQEWVKEQQTAFFNGESFKPQGSILKNSIRACTHIEQLLGENSRVQLRLLEPIRVAGVLIPKGELLTASAKVSGDRLLLTVKSLEYKGKVIPVSIAAYDIDGQQGLYLPASSDANAFREIAAGMSKSSGSSFTFSSSAKDQIVSELSKGVVQGGTSFLSKKIAQPSIRVKAGYQLLLISKK